jgi:hypothetical protein
VPVLPATAALAPATARVLLPPFTEPPGPASAPRR